MNAYLTYAAFIGAGLYGIRNKIEIPPEHKGNGYIAPGSEPMPRALHEAIRCLEASEAAVEISRTRSETLDSATSPFCTKRRAFPSSPRASFIHRMFKNVLRPGRPAFGFLTTGADRSTAFRVRSVCCSRLSMWSKDACQ